MRYRKLDNNGDYSFGNNASDFYVDQPEAVAQAVRTRLYLQRGEWFLDVSDGTDWDGSVLGVRTENTRDVELRGRIAGTQGVNELLGYASARDASTRKFSVNVALDTIYGPITTTA